VLVGETYHDRFRIEALLGKGGQGAVFLASDLETRHCSNPVPQRTGFEQCRVKETYRAIDSATIEKFVSDGTWLPKGNYLSIGSYASDDVSFYAWRRGRYVDVTPSDPEAESDAH
jgi:hypothetical protein